MGNAPSLVAVPTACAMLAAMAGSGTNVTAHAAAAAALDTRHDALLAAWLACVGLPDGRDGSRLADDVAQALDGSLRALYSALSTPRQDDAQQLAFLRGHIRRTVLRGVRGPSLMRWCHQLERLVWDELTIVAEGDPVVAADLLGTARRVMEFVEALNKGCAQAYEETETALAGSGDAVRSQLVERLVGGELLRSGVLRQAAEACGLQEGRPVVATVLRPESAFTDDGQAAVAAFAVAAAAPGDPAPVATLRGDAVSLAPIDESSGAAHAAALRATHRRLDDQGIPSRIGVSVAHDDVRSAPEAYSDALLAVDLCAASRPVVALAEQAALDYLVMRAGDRTAWGLVPRALRDLLTEDSDEARALVDTLLALVTSDGNVRVAAHRLHVHANTVHGRLAKIRMLTGLDPRSFADLRDLYLAVRLARAGGART